MTAIVLQGDARSLPLPDASVDLIVTSPPYFGLRSYTDSGEHYDGQIGSEKTPREYVANLLACTREWVRVLKPGGSLFVNLGDKYSTVGGGPPGQSSGIGVQRGGRNQHLVSAKQSFTTSGPPKSLLGLPWRYALGCIDDLGLILRAEIIWSKPNGLPESVTDRVRRSHEQLFHFTRQPRYFSAVDEIREAYSENKPWGAAQRGPSKPSIATAVVRGSDPSQQQGGLSKNKERIDNPLGKLPGSVWEIPSQPLIVPAHLGIDHFAAFPMELPRRVILGWSPPSSVVLDPFGGTGTTALVASMLGRTGISFDRSADYCRLARWRTSDPAERARALGVPKPPPVPDGQGDLFEAVS